MHISIWIYIDKLMDKIEKYVLCSVYDLVDNPIYEVERQCNMVPLNSMGTFIDMYILYINF
jgi:hypothetical protein